jgi:hypothetical protein
MTAAYQLFDVEERQALWPWSFTIPSLTERISVLPGDKVQLIFMKEGTRAGTSAWVNVTTSPTDDPRCFHGQLAESVPNHLALGDHVDFEPRHICLIRHNPRPPLEKR